jgi:perosamine synthetase
MMAATKAKHINLMQPYVTDAMRAGVAEVLQSRFIGQGPRVNEFERRFSLLVGGRECVAVGSCTDALHLAYLLAGIGPGDEVIVPLFTCTATNIPLLWMGADIKFADVGPDSLNVSAETIKPLLTERTKAIVVVHYGGSPVDLEDIWAFGYPVIEDCAQALGARYQGFPVGCYSKFSCFSFQAVKHVTTGDGGMLIVPKGMEDQAKRMRWFGIDRAAKLQGVWANDITEVGYKYQMTDIAAAMGIAGIDALDQQLDLRHLLLHAYQVGLHNVPGIRIISDDIDGAAWLCTVLAENREGLRAKLAEHGIESNQSHYRNDRYTVFEKFRRPGQFPNMDAIDGKYLLLPLHMGMTDEDVNRICEVIRGGW